MLYTTVTISDFKDSDYINQLLKRNIGMELALLTHLADVADAAQQQKDLDALKKEIADFKTMFDAFGVDISKVRIHQPGGYSYAWFSGFDLLKDFFSYCRDIGLKKFTIHGPYGNVNADVDVELADFRKKLQILTEIGTVEVEEIVASCSEGVRCYNGKLLEKLLSGQQATMLLDTYECGGIEGTIKRMQDLANKNFAVHSIHIHKDKHKFLSIEELVALLKSGFGGNIINEAFVQNQSSFEEFIKTKSKTCIVSNEQRIALLEQYQKQMNVYAS